MTALGVVVVGGSVLILVLLLAVLVFWKLTAMRSRAITEPLAEAPGPCDPWCPGCENPIHKRAPGPSVWDALDRHLTDQPDEINPLMREIYAALSLARDGVDVEKGAPREWVP